MKDFVCICIEIRIVRILCIMVVLLSCSAKADDVDTWILQGMKNLDDGLYEDALLCFDKVLHVDPNYVIAYQHRSSVLIRMGQSEDARAAMTTANQIAQKWQSQAQQFLDTGDYTGAIAYCDKLIQHKTTLQSWAWNTKGVCTYKLGNYQGAMQYYDRALEFPDLSENHIVLYNKASCLLALKRYQDALTYYDKVLLLNRNYRAAWQDKATALTALGHYAEAKLARDRTRSSQVNETTGVVDSLISQANLHYTKKSYQETLFCLNQALELDSSNTTALNLKGVVFISLGRAEEALRCFDKTIETDSEHLQAYKNRCVALRTLGRNREANISQRQATRIANTWQSMVETFFDSEEYEKGIERCKMLIDHNERTAWAWNMQGVCLCNMEEYEQALDCFERSLKDFANDYIVLCNQGYSLLELQRYNEARRCFAKATTLKPREKLAWQGTVRAMEALSFKEKARHAQKKIRSIERRVKFIHMLGRGAVISILCVSICVLVGIGCALKHWRKLTIGIIVLGVLSFAVFFIIAILWMFLRWTFWVGLAMALCAFYILLRCILLWRENCPVYGMRRWSWR